MFAPNIVIDITFYWYEAGQKLVDHDRTTLVRSRSNYFYRTDNTNCADVFGSITIKLLCSQRTTRPNIPFCTYYAHYVYSVIRISVCESGHSKTYAITFASIEDSDQPSHPTVWTGSSQCTLSNHVFHTLYLSHASEEFALIRHMFASVTYTRGDR